MSTQRKSDNEKLTVDIHFRGTPSFKKHLEQTASDESAKRLCKVTVTDIITSAVLKVYRPRTTKKETKP